MLAKHPNLRVYKEQLCPPSWYPLLEQVQLVWGFTQIISSPVYLSQEYFLQEQRMFRVSDRGPVSEFGSGSAGSINGNPDQGAANSFPSHTWLLVKVITIHWNGHICVLCHKTRWLGKASRHSFDTALHLSSIWGGGCVWKKALLLTWATDFWNP